MSTLDGIRDGVAETDDDLQLTKIMARLAEAGYRAASIPFMDLGSAAAQAGLGDATAWILLEHLKRGGLLAPIPDMDSAEVRDEIQLSLDGAEVLERYRDAVASSGKQRRAQFKIARRALLLWASENRDRGSDAFLASPYGHYFGRQLTRDCIDDVIKDLDRRGLITYFASNNIGTFARLTLTPEGSACAVDFEGDIDRWEMAQRQQTAVPSISNVFHSQVGNVVQGGTVYGGLTAYIHAASNDPREIAALLLAVVKASAVAGELSEAEMTELADQVTADLEAVVEGDIEKGRLERIAAAMKTLGAEAAGGAATAVGSTTVQSVLLPVLTTMGS